MYNVDPFVSSVKDKRKELCEKSINFRIRRNGEKQKNGKKKMKKWENRNKYLVLLLDTISSHSFFLIPIKCVLLNVVDFSMLKMTTVCKFN